MIISANLLAESASEVSTTLAPFMPLFNLGAVGAVLGWFMFRAEPRLKAIERATDRQTKALILLTLNLPECNSATKSLAHEIDREIDECSRR